jgi:Ni/Fe-hydrogenase 1 B-type cytochrome subunit
MTTAVDSAPSGSEDIVRAYVWEVPVRLAHWLIAFSIVVLAATGFYIGNPFVISSGPAGQRFVMGTVKVVHFYAAIVFTLAVLARVAWMFLGNKYSSWDKFIPVARQRRASVWPTVEFYLFMLRKPPGFVGHNPVAGLAYCTVFLLYFVSIVTGLGMYAVSAHADSWLRSFEFVVPLLGGLPVLRWTHHVVMWLLLGFAVHHVYSSVLMSTVEANATIESMFSGYKFVPREDLIYSGYRFRPRRKQAKSDG